MTLISEWDMFLPRMHKRMDMCLYPQAWIPRRDHLISESYSLQSIRSATYCKTKNCVTYMGISEVVGEYKESQQRGCFPDLEVAKNSLPQAANRKFVRFIIYSTVQ